MFLQGRMTSGDDLTGKRAAWWASVAEWATSELAAVMWGQPGKGLRSQGHDPRGVHARELIIMLLDLHEVDGVPEARRLKEVACVGPQNRHLGQFLPVAFAECVVDGIESDKSGEEPDVRLGDGIANQIPIRP
jgi:hypothetical protein